MTDTILSLRDVSVRYGSGDDALYALNGVTLSLERGGAIGVVGESGSGKSTLALALMGLLGRSATVESSQMEFDGTELSHLSGADRAALRGRRIGMVFQDPFTALNPALTISRILTEPLMLHRGMGEAEAKKTARGLLDEVGIPDSGRVMRAYPHALSGGMKQRALIAAALAGEPDLLILDEPTTALDVTIEAQILDLLAQLRAERQLSMIFISHNLSVIARVVDEVCVLYASQVVELGPRRRVFHTPSHPYTKGLLASMVKLDDVRERLETIPGRLPDLRDRPTGCYFEPRCPFSETGCKKPQSMVAVETAHESRCWKAKGLLDEPWHVAETDPLPPRPARPENTADILVARDVEKSFARTSGLRAVSLDFSGGFPIRYAPDRFRAVDKVSLSVGVGETVGLVGESGCGKSTLARCLIRLVQPDGGEIEIDGQDVTTPGATDPRQLARTAQIVFQNPDSSLNPRKTVRQILSRPLRLFNDGQGKDLEKEVERLLDMVRLSARYMDRYPHEMSGGEKQRIGIARALATNPSFLICDEAVSALDVSVQASVLNLLADLRDELGLAYLFITHDLSVVRHIADRIAVMYRGGIVEIGPAEHLRTGPHHPYTEALLSAAPTLESDGEDTRVRLAGSVNTSGKPVTGCRFADRCPRKIGAICDDQDPPWKENADGVRFSCHHTLDELSRPIAQS